MVRGRNLDLGGAPTSYNQRRLWPLVSEIPESNVAYNINVAMEVRGPLDRAALRASFDKLISRHESLRTRLKVDDGVLRQFPAYPASGQFLEISARTEREMTPSCIREIVRVEANRPFDLYSTESLFRAVLVCVGDAHYVLVLVAHHLVNDGWSMGRICKELSVIYNSKILGRPDGLPEIEIQYSDFARWEREWVSSVEAKEGVDYWLRTLYHDVPLDETAAARSVVVPGGETFRGDRYHFSVESHLVDRLRQLVDRADASLSTVMLFAFSCLLSGTFGTQHQSIGVAMSNRLRREVQNTVGYFSNTTPLRLEAEPSETVLGAIAKAQRAANEAFYFQDIPLGAVVQEAEHQGSYVNPVPFRFMYVFHNQPLFELDFHGTDTHWLRIDRTACKKELSLLVSLVEKNVECTIEYSTEKYSRSDIARFADSFKNMLSVLSCESTTTIDEVLNAVK